MKPLRPTSRSSPVIQKISPESLQLAESKLAESGLTLTDAADLGIEVLDPLKTKQLHPTFQARPALKLQYFDPRVPGKKPLSPHPAHPPFYRLRYLGKANDPSVLTDKKEVRYTQPPESGLAAYFPTVGGWDWASHSRDHSLAIIITEGELKAACATKRGYPTIGLGGVYNFQSAKAGIAFLPELEAVNWVGRYVYICYDSDFRTNEAVCVALMRLAELLCARGAHPHMVALPTLHEGKKTGLDDFLMDPLGGEKKFDQLLGQSQPLTLSRPLWTLNDRVVYVADPGVIIRRDTGYKMGPDDFKSHAFGNIEYVEQVVDSEGNLKLKPAAAAAKWLTWPHRREVYGLTYAPGQEEFVPHEFGQAYNLWGGWGVQPKAGDVEPFLTLVNHVFTGAEVGAKEWFLKWCACPLQNPGLKLFSSCVIYGVRHGTGKSLIGYTLGRIYGKNFTEITQANLHENHNEWAECKQFVMGDDVTGSNKRADNDLLKKLITQKEMRVNPKYIRSYTVVDRINYLFTSNHPDAFFLEDDDRRFFIHEVTVAPMDEDFYVDYAMWLESGGAAAVFDYLLKLNLDDFNPGGKAFFTEAKARMIQDVKSDLGSWVSRLAHEPELMLVIGEAKMKGDLFTARQLLMLYDPDKRTGTTANGVTRELRRAGIPAVLGGKLLKTSVGTERFYVLRNQSRWTAASVTVEEVDRHLTTTGSKEKVLKY